jgi:hypothetical protein
MTPTLTTGETELPAVDGWRTGDSREFLFTVAVDDAGTPKDVSNDELRWELLEKPYQTRSAALHTEASAGIDLRTDPFVDPTAGEFEVVIDEDVVTGRGELYQRVVVGPPGDSRQSWVGPVERAVRGGGDA